MSGSAAIAEAMLEGFGVNYLVIALLLREVLRKSVFTTFVSIRTRSTIPIMIT
jgi:hypothetical protein